MEHAEAMDTCPTCGEGLTSRVLSQSSPAEHPRLRRGPTRELRRCQACRRLATRDAGSSQPWMDGGLDPSIDYLFDWEPRPLPEPWVLLPDAQAREILEAQLRLEVSEGHPLFGKPVIALARCNRCDEVVFSVEDDPVRFVQVHLTWRQGPETPPWPATEYLSMPLADNLAEHH